jgi:hypothetical protein
MISFEELVRRFQLEVTDSPSGRFVAGELGQVRDLCGEPVAVIRLGSGSDKIRKLAFAAVRPNGVQNAPSRARKAADKEKGKRVKELTAFAEKDEDEFREL